MPLTQDNKTEINFINSILIFVENCVLICALHDFSVGLRTGSNPADINRFRCHSGHKYQNIDIIKSYDGKFSFLTASIYKNNRPI